MQHNMQLRTTDVEGVSCIRVIGPRMSVKALVLDVEG